LPSDIAIQSHKATRLAADVGGTFTDVDAFDERTGELKLGKTLTTPQRLVNGIGHGVEKAGLAFRDAGLFLHGTTTAINTILERNGARTGLLITRGFRDIYEIGRINRPEAYNLYFRKHQPLVERHLRREVNERVTFAGEVLQPLDPAEIVRLAGELVADGCEAIAVLFLHSYRSPAHEAEAKRVIQASFPDLFVTASHELSQEYREFERASTTAANAYIGPKVRGYLRELNGHLHDESFAGTFLIVQSSGGLFDLDKAQSECIRMLESGPAAGVIGTKALCERIGLENAIAFDMGGTTAKAGVIHRGTVLMTSSTLVGGYAEGLPVQVPMIDIQEVGTGGGSIAQVGLAGALRVGPHSAGAVPGPACYGLGGTEPTVTDANLVLGRISADRFLGGEMPLDLDAAKAAIKEKIGAPLGLDLIAAADGIIRIAATKMSHVVRWVTTERGLDASDFAFVAYGGAGPLHAATVARELQAATVIVPRAPGHFSAFGMLVADPRRDFVRTWFKLLEDAAFDNVETMYAEMESEGRRAIGQARLNLLRITVTRGADMRYVGQEHAVTVDLPLDLFVRRDRAAIKAHFDAVHEQRYGYAAPKEEAEIVSLRSAVIGQLHKPAIEEIARGTAEPPRVAFRGDRPVYFKEADGFVATQTYDRTGLLAGNRISGPALVEEYASTTVVHPGDELRVDAFGNLVIGIGRS